MHLLIEPTRELHRVREDGTRDVIDQMDNAMAEDTVTSANASIIETPAMEKQLPSPLSPIPSPHPPPRAPKTINTPPRRGSKLGASKTANRVNSPWWNDRVA